jgi:hypothetical protein
MDESQVAELGRYFDEYMYGDPKLPGTQQAVLCFKAIARDVYASAPEEMKKALSLERYIAAIIIPEVLAHLEKRQSPHPAIMPEKISKK